MHKDKRQLKVLAIMTLGMLSLYIYRGGNFYGALYLFHSMCSNLHFPFDVRYKEALIALVKCPFFGNNFHYNDILFYCVGKVNFVHV